MLEGSKQRRTIRLAGHDYVAGAYFVTICAHQKRSVFGRLHDEELKINRYGELVAEQWLQTRELRAEVSLDEWIVMPNHFHGIILLNSNCRGLARCP